MRNLKIILSSIAVAATASCAAPGADMGSGAMAANNAKQCFRSGDVRTFSDAGPNVVLVSVRSKEVWELTLSPGCPKVDYAASIGIAARGTSRICSGADAELLIPNASGSGSQRCMIRNIRKYTPEEAAAVRS